MRKLLTTFERNHGADLGEKIGLIGLGLLRIGFGKTVTVENISSGANKVFFTERVYSTSAKVVAIGLFILACPLTIPLAGIGCVGAACSKSHVQIFNSYMNSVIRRNSLENNAAATTIQKYFRGHLARKPHLPGGLYPQYRVQCEKATGLEEHSIPRANGGRTSVYLPQEMPEIVLKHSGRKQAIRRFYQMKYVRSILDLQNSTHLIIPKANLCQEFLIEQRLPINADSYHNMGLYLSQPWLFDEAVGELTRLFSRIYLSDLVACNHHPLGHIAGVKGDIRYDNLPLYVVEENGKQEGKLGLIDLEHLDTAPHPQGLETLVRIFPLHLEVIKNEARKLSLIVNDSELDISQQNGKKYLQGGFTDHLEWLRQRGVSTSILSQHFQVSPQRIEQFILLIKKELIKINSGQNDIFTKMGYIHQPDKNFFTGAPEGIAQTLAEKIAPLLIENIENQINTHQNKQLNQIQTVDMTESQLVCLRSPLMNRRNLYEGVVQLISNNKNIVFNTYDDYSEKHDIAEQLTAICMEELVRGGEIFYFDPAYYAGGHEVCWIRY